mgnify:FL=1|tara:strand:+ start:132 stop:317 length:186 start_codon:yes stop_codon:yes gene_type:complete
MINVEMDVMTAIAVRSSLFNDTKVYTYDEGSCPTRVTNIRSVIVELDKQIEEALTNEVVDT